MGCLVSRQAKYLVEGSLVEVGPGLGPERGPSIGAVYTGRMSKQEKTSDEEGGVREASLESTFLLASDPDHRIADLQWT